MCGHFSLAFVFLFFIAFVFWFSLAVVFGSPLISFLVLFGSVYFFDCLYGVVRRAMKMGGNARELREKGGKDWEYKGG